MRSLSMQGGAVVALERFARVENSAFGERRSATTTDFRQLTVGPSKAQNAMDNQSGGCMRTHKLMLNADSETIAALNRARNAKAAAALMLVFSLAVIVLTAPARASASQVSIELSTGNSEPLMDKHDFINTPKSVEVVTGAKELEQLFWMCDYAATAGTLQNNEIEMCGAVTEQLKLSKFDGDFEKLLAWWRVSKEVEHQVLLGDRVIGSCARDA